jgi:predicted dehydrogenase
MKQLGRHLPKTDGRARIAVVGAGWWSQGWHLPQLDRNPQAELAAIVDPNAHPSSPMSPDMLSLAELSELYRVPTFESFDALLASDVGGIDGVVVGAAHHVHHEVPEYNCVSRHSS